MRENCAAQFGERFTLESVQNAVENTNQIYGGRTLQVENVTFISRGLDPWRMFGIQDLFKDVDTNRLENIKRSLDKQEAVDIKDV